MNDSPGSPQERYEQRLRRPSSAEQLRARLVAAEQQNFADALSRLADDPFLIEAAASLVAARRRFVLGAGRSRALAALAAADLAAGLAQVVLIDGAANRAIDVLGDVRDTDVLLALSFRRYDGTTLAIAEEFAAEGGTVIGVADDAEAPIARLAQCTIVVPTASASSADSPTAIASAIHLLSTLTIASAKGARRRLQNRERLRDLLQDPR